MSEWRDIHAYIDGETDSNERAELEQLLAHCKRTQCEYEAAKLVKQTLRQHCAGVSDDSLWHACTSRLDEIDKSNRATHFVSRYAWAICGVFFLAILVGGLNARLNPNSSMSSGELAQVFSGIVPTPRGDSSKPEELRQWFREQLGGTPEVVAQKKFAIIGRGAGVVNGHRVARVNLADANGPLALIFLEGNSEVQGSEPVADRSAMRAGVVDNVQYVTWRDGPHRVFLVGNRSIGELATIAAVMSGK